MRQPVSATSTRRAIALPLACAALALSGCATGDYGYGGGWGGGGYRPPQERPLPPSQAPVTEYDAQLGTRVYQALARDPRIGSATISVIPRGGGVIELQGSPSGIPKADAIAQALRVAGSVWGVRGVINKMTMTSD